MKHANEVRFGDAAEIEKEEAIDMTEEWANQLAGMNFTSKQKGRMTHLMKKKSKVAKPPEPRKTYEPYNFVKKFKSEGGKVIDVPVS